MSLHLAVQRFGIRVARCDLATAGSRFPASPPRAGSVSTTDLACRLFLPLRGTPGGRSTTGVGQALPRIFLPRQRQVTARRQGHKHTIRLPTPWPRLRWQSEDPPVPVLVPVEGRKLSKPVEMG